MVKRISFVILCYQAIECTQKNIEHLQKMLRPEGYELQIILVDNNSPDGSGRLLHRFEADNVKVILNKENLGFAKGNNVGFRYAKEIGSEFIILANSDTYITDNMFLYKLLDCYDKDAFDIAGPQICSLVDNCNQNPVARQYNCIRDIEKRVLKDGFLYILSYAGMDSLLQNAYRKYSKHTAYNKKADPEDFQLHGAFMIFGPQYVTKYDGLYDNTFMYGEENILKYISVRDCLKMRYLDKLLIYHEEGSSTTALYGKTAKKRRFCYYNGIKSCLLLKQMIIKDNKNTKKQLYL